MLDATMPFDTAMKIYLLNGGPLIYAMEVLRYVLVYTARWR